MARLRILFRSGIQEEAVMSEIRYYILPAIRDPSWQNNPDNTGPPPDAGVQPKYLDQITPYLDPTVNCPARGIIAQELAPDVTGRRWVRDHYIVRLVAPDGTDWTLLDSRPDAQRITRQLLIENTAKLEAIGIDTTGLTLTTPRKAIERRLLQWLTEEDRDFSDVFGEPGEQID